MAVLQRTARRRNLQTVRIDLGLVTDTPQRGKDTEMKIKVTGFTGLKSNDEWDHSHNIAQQTHVRIDFADYNATGDFIKSWRVVLTSEELFELLETKLIRDV